MKIRPTGSLLSISLALGAALAACEVVPIDDFSEDGLEFRVGGEGEGEGEDPGEGLSDIEFQEWLDNLDEAQLAQAEEMMQAFFNGEAENYAALQADLFGVSVNIEDSDVGSQGMCGEVPCLWIAACGIGAGEPPGENCDVYSPSHRYLGVGMRCFCQEAGTSDWANYVRDCLHCGHWEKDICDSETHVCCYSAATAAGHDLPLNDLLNAAYRC